jgi:hypothetical protein
LWGCRVANVVYPQTYPVLEIDSKVIPNIANNLQNAQANGEPTVLTRTTDQASVRANRMAAPTLVAEFHKMENESNAGIKWAIANALSVVADDKVFADIMDLV